MCKVLALSALLANSNDKASAITSIVVGTASSFSTAENGGGATALRQPNADPSVPPKFILSSL